MTAHLRDVSTHTSSAGDEATLAELRKTIDGLAKDIATVAEKRAKQGAEAVDAGATALKRQIRRQPVIAIGTAALAGALLAVLIVPRHRTRTPSSRWAAWSPVTRSDLDEVADRLHRSVKRATSSVSSVPISSSLERLADALTRADREAGISSALERVGSWWSKAQSSATSKK